jgi:hypothetical protein
MLRNRETKTALWVGASTAILTAFSFALGIILDEGGGSLSRGWDPGWNYLSFYGIFMIPVIGIVGLIAMGLSRLIGAGIVLGVSVLGLGYVSITGALSSTPKARLEGITGRSVTPDVVFGDYVVGHTFSDGTSFLWVVSCSPAEAPRFASSLGLIQVPTVLKIDGFEDEHHVVKDYRAIFEEEIDGVDFYRDNKALIGGYNANEQKFRLYWWPPITEQKQDG